MPRYSPNDATASVKTIIDQSIAVFKDQQLSAPDREPKLRAIAESHFDFAEMSRSAIGYHWKTLTPAQQAEFVPLFTTFIEDAFLFADRIYSVEKINQQIKSSLIQFTPANQRQAPTTPRSSAPSRCRTSKKPIEVNYLMRHDGRRVENLRHHDRRHQRNRELPQPVQPRPEQRRLRQARQFNSPEDPGPPATRQRRRQQLAAARDVPVMHVQAEL